MYFLIVEVVDFFCFEYYHGLKVQLTSSHSSEVQ